jgi:heme/copper-type cytochrome/quinol oxidase subunit 2
MLTLIRWFLMVSGVLFWGVIAVIVVVEVRMRRYLHGHADDWPEPDFDKLREMRRKTRFESGSWSSSKSSEKIGKR